MQFDPESFFSLERVSFSEFIKSVDQVWKLLPLLSEYINQQFDKKSISSNFKEGKNIFIGEGTTIHEGASIVGSAIIGKNCSIGHGALLRENCLIGDNVKIGHGVEVKNSICMNNTTIAHLNYVGDSIIGNDVNISGGVIIANYRLDKQMISIKVDNSTRLETGLTKFGCVMGDNVNIGVNAVINPGSILGKKSIVYPLVSVTGVHNDNAIIK